MKLKLSFFLANVCFLIEPEVVDDGEREVLRGGVAAQVTRLHLAFFDGLLSRLAQCASMLVQVQMVEQVGAAENHCRRVGDLPERERC